MSEITLFTSVKYNSHIENPPVTGWLAKQLDNWTFPFFGSKIEVIEFDKVARYREDTTKSNCLTVALRILLFVTILFPLIVLIARTIIRRNIEYKKFEGPKVSPPKIKQDILRLSGKHAGKEIQVPAGKPFSIELFYSITTGHRPWKISQIPSFINHLDHYIDYRNNPPDICGGGDDYVFVFEPKKPGRGDIVMQLPDLGGNPDPSYTVEERFTIVAV
jgi:hypothetical protein